MEGVLKMFGLSWFKIIGVAVVGALLTAFIVDYRSGIQAKERVAQLEESLRIVNEDVAASKIISATQTMLAEQSAKDQEAADAKIRELDALIDLSPTAAAVCIDRGLARKLRAL